MSHKLAWTGLVLAKSWRLPEQESEIPDLALVCLTISFRVDFPFQTYAKRCTLVGVHLRRENGANTAYIDRFLSYLGNAMTPDVGEDGCGDYEGNVQEVGQNLETRPEAETNLRFSMSDDALRQQLADEY